MDGWMDGEKRIIFVQCINSNIISNGITKHILELNK